MKQKRKSNPSVALAVFLLVTVILSGCSRENPATLMRRAQRYEHQGAYRKAAVELKGVIKKQPNNIAARILLGTVALQLGSPIYAQKQFERAQKEGASPDSIQPLLADAFLGQGHYKRLLKVIRVKPSQPVTVQARLLASRGQALIALKREKDAGAAFEQALHLDPGQPQALIGQAELALSSGDRAAASRRLDAALKGDDNAMRAWLLKGMIAVHEKRLDDAETDYRRAIKGTSLSVSPYERFMARGRLATVLMQEGKNRQALSLIDWMLHLSPRHPLPNYLRAILAYHQKHYNLASEKLQIVLDAAPNDARAQALLGVIKEKQGDLQQAEMYLTSAVAADPSNPHLVVALAQVQLQMGDHDRALSTLNDAIGRGVTNPMVTGMLENTIMSVGQSGQGLAYLKRKLLPEAHNAVVQMSLASAFMKAGLNGQALALLKKVQVGSGGTAARKEILLITTLLRSGNKLQALQEAKKMAKSQPRVALWHDVLGRLYMILGQDDAARAQFQVEKRLQPNSPESTINLAILALRERNFKEAIREVSSLHGNKQSPAAMLLLSRAYLGLGRDKKAVAVLQEAVDKYPDAPGPLLVMVRYDLGNHRPGAATALVERALSRHPDDAGLTDLLGLTQLAGGATGNAIRSFSKAVKEAPKVVGFQLNLARAQIAAKRFSDAVHTLSKAHKEHPADIMVTEALAFAQLRDKHPEAAFATAQTLQKESALKGRGDVLAGRLYEMQHDYAAADRAFEHAARQAGSGALLTMAVNAREAGHINPPEQPLLDWVHQHTGDVAAIALLAQWYNQHHFYGPAAHWYRELTKGHGRYVPIMLNNLALVYLKLRDQRALPAAERAYREAPHVAAIADTLGWVQLRRGNLREANKYLNQAVLEDPDNPDMLYHLAYLMARSGKKDAALKELARAFEIKGAFDERAAAEALRKQLHG